MENTPNDYEPGIDQNQGVVGTMARNQQQSTADATQMPDLDPNLATDDAGDSVKEEGVAPDLDNLGEQTFVSDEGGEQLVE